MTIIYCLSFWRFVFFSSDSYKWALTRSIWPKLVREFCPSFTPSCLPSLCCGASCTRLTAPTNQPLRLLPPRPTSTWAPPRYIRPTFVFVSPRLKGAFPHFLMWQSIKCTFVLFLYQNCEMANHRMQNCISKVPSLNLKQVRWKPQCWHDVTFFSCLCSKNLRQQILELLGPISMNHGAHFMAAIAYVWNERRQVKTPVRNKVSVEKRTKGHCFQTCGLILKFLKQKLNCQDLSNSWTRLQR